MSCLFLRSETSLYLFQECQLKSWSNLSWNGYEQAVKRNVVVSIESPADFRKFLARSLPEYFTFREMVISSDEIIFAENELKGPALNAKVEHLSIKLRRTNKTTINLLLRKIRNVDKLNLTLSNFSLNGSAQNLILFNNFPEQSVLSEHLKYLTISGVDHPITVDDIFLILLEKLDAYRLHYLQLSEVHLFWTSLNKLKGFVNGMKLYSQKRGNFELVLERTTVSIGNVHTNCNLIVTMVLSSALPSYEEIQNITSSGGYSLKDRHGEETIEFLALTHRDSVFTNIELCGIVSASSCESLTKLCAFWKISSDVAHLTAKNLQMKCADDMCEKGCSSVMFFLQNLRVSRPEDLNYHFWKRIFSIEGISRLNQILTQEGHEKPVLKIPTTADEMKLRIQCHESRNEYLLNQQQLFSNFEKRGVQFKKVSILVDTDDTGWAFFKFHLNQTETKIEFSKKAIVTFPAKSTSGIRLVCIEVHPIPEKVIKRVCESKQIEACHISPVVFIDHTEAAPFLQPVSVEVPYSSTKILVPEDNLRTTAFTKHNSEEIEWQIVPETTITKSMYTVKYTTKKFSPFSSITERILSYLNFSHFAISYFPNCVYVTIWPLDLQHKPRNVIFDCIKITEAELSKMKLSMPTLEIRKLGEMTSENRIFADLGPNLKMDCFFHKGQGGQRLQFFCPEHISNRRELIMERVDKEKEPQGIVSYSHSPAGVEEELFQLCYSVRRMLDDGKRATAQVNRGVNTDANQQSQPVETTTTSAGEDVYIEAEPVSFSNLQ